MIVGMCVRVYVRISTEGANLLAFPLARYL